MATPDEPKLTAPYGSWKSLVSTDIVSGTSKRLQGTSIDSHVRLFLLEYRLTRPMLHLFRLPQILAPRLSLMLMAFLIGALTVLLLGGKISVKAAQIQLQLLYQLASMQIKLKVTIPLGHYDKCPVSVSFIARHGRDRFLLDTMKNMYAFLQEQADLFSKPKSSHDTEAQKELVRLRKKREIKHSKFQWQKANIHY
ncbi:Translocon at the outer membrane of chloroplasts 64 [Euphorbia peplus]|nr:Translocon at the outer membrane of chloroplasts 64 [Euphorbia peplus]